MVSQQVHAHYFPSNTVQETPSQDIIINQLTLGVSSEQQHGPVRSGETLSSIAKQRAPVNMSRQQYMNMLFQLNPQAFIDRNRNKLKVNSLLTLPGYQNNSTSIKEASIAKQRTQFNDQQIQLIEYDPLLRVKTSAGAGTFFPQVPIRVILPNTLNRQQKQNKLQTRIQQTVIHEQMSLLQQVSQLEQQLNLSQKTVTELNLAQQGLNLKNHKLLLQIKELHVKYDHIIENYNFSPKF